MDCQSQARMRSLLERSAKFPWYWKLCWHLLRLSMKLTVYAGIATTTNSQNSSAIHQPYQRSLEETSEQCQSLSRMRAHFPVVVTCLLYLLFEPWFVRPIHLSSAHSKAHAEPPEIKGQWLPHSQKPWILAWTERRAIFKRVVFLTKAQSSWLGSWRVFWWLK